MDANEPTPRTGENVTEEPLDWEAAGRALLSGELERRATLVQSSFYLVADRLAEGREWTSEDLRQLDESVQQAKELVDLLWEADQGTKTYGELLAEKEGEE